MRIISWNILQGGGTRCGQIGAQLRQWQPDLVLLSEFRGRAPSRSIADSLLADGLTHQLSTVDPEHPSAYRLLIASREPLKQHPVSGILAEMGRFLHVTVVSDCNLDILAIHVPNKNEGDKYGIQAAVLEQFEQLNGRNAMAMGDTNSGVPGLDEQVPFFHKKDGQWFAEINRIGWCDVWRENNPEAVEFTYYHNTGRGFRIDQLFAPHELCDRIQVSHDWGVPAMGKFRGPSDHAALVIDL